MSFVCWKTGNIHPSAMDEIDMLTFLEPEEQGANRTLVVVRKLAP